MYSVDFEKLRDDNLPFLLQKPVMQVFCAVLMSVIVRLHGEFTAFREAKDIRLAHNGQVNSLEAILNLTFDAALNRIYLVDAVIPEDNYIGCRTNLNQTYIASHTGLTPPDDFYIGNAPFRFSEYDFIVMVPHELLTQEVKIRKLVEEYKTAGKTFDIQEIL